MRDCIAATILIPTCVVFPTNVAVDAGVVSRMSQIISNILHLQPTVMKLRRFCKSRILADLKAQGLSVPHSITKPSQLNVCGSNGGQGIVDRWQESHFGLSSKAGQHIEGPSRHAFRL